MSELSIHPAMMALSYDSNRNGKVSDELKVKQNAETLRAIGGDAEVTVMELATALRNDKVVINNGEIQAKSGPVPRVALFNNYGSIQAEVQNIRDQLSSSATAPKELPLEPDSDSDRFNQELSALDSDYEKVFQAANEGHLKLKQSADSLNDPTLKSLIAKGDLLFRFMPSFQITEDHDFSRLMYAKQQERFIHSTQDYFKAIADHLSEANKS
ncbi:hypothetical protein COW36_07460 [bacterium (Candidatus Blackallbacteria) CG17_big_fil_post_rev_8_21_14_2_50_48_46]|uniref:Uncharacterized protein n=1 Tax=bacterium (Candidatus Blackallbacteria) CG17_big_fil_post_rev_8_21_14_2_50_48_46 TaxID=2014261 RepID=A0A2M7G760_9BACT|nr:MAG: hypothetical protein COW64_16560 [bacterium (Candidatus Blackallbacteria) CG18_big_fil_WC_8_21_14_2_50_49_26]PIW17773.1 MAG: hypothetical protein COW36_07460 [bacterium (Candidatus Blackallbacteria) CG17_big_fil_post_rev_8_21_14_2_50_48_46]PIW47332.1 MAG: hypothetical protein COW20_12985 [bacterium (Candidatus Blackallbacteria) CG13_big_fil_rev_8_21_14_2_50_49_14]